MTYTACKFIVKPDLHGAALQSYAPCSILAGMDKKRRYFREWRKHRHLTQDQVVDRLKALDDPLVIATGASLSRLETGAQIYNERILDALAEIYQCEAWELVGRDPTKEGKVVDLVRVLDERRQSQVAAFLKALDDTPDGTNG